MSSIRLPRINQLIKEELSQIILKELEISPDILITITRVETTQDLLDANIFISIFPEKNITETMDFLKRKAGFLQKEIKHVLKMRPLPRLHLLAEKETKKAGRIEEILEQLKNQGK